MVKQKKKQEEQTLEEKVEELQTKLEAHQWAHCSTEDEPFLQEWVFSQKRLRRFIIGYEKVEKAYDQLSWAAEKRGKHDLWGLLVKPIGVELREALRGGAFYARGVSAEGYPVVWQRSRNIDCGCSEPSRIKAAVMALDSLEEGMDNAKFLHEKWVLVLDQSSSAKNGSPSMTFGKHILTMTLNFYPERMYKCYILDAGWLPNMLYSAIKPLLGEKTNAKISFLNRKKNKSPAETCEKLIDIVGPASTDAEYGGTDAFSWDPDRDWAIGLLTKTSDECEADPLDDAQLEISLKRESPERRRSLLQRILPKQKAAAGRLEEVEQRENLAQSRGPSKDRIFDNVSEISFHTVDSQVVGVGGGDGTLRVCSHERRTGPQIPVGLPTTIPEEGGRENWSPLSAKRTVGAHRNRACCWGHPS